MYENDFQTTKCKIEKLLRQLFSLSNCSFCFMAKARDIKEHKITGKRYPNEKANKKLQSCCSLSQESSSIKAFLLLIHFFLC